MKEPASGMAKRGVRGQVGVRGQWQPRSRAFDDENRNCVRCTVVASRRFYTSFHILGGEHVRASKKTVRKPRCIFKFHISCFLWDLTAPCTEAADSQLCGGPTWTVWHLQWTCLRL